MSVVCRTAALHDMQLDVFLKMLGLNTKKVAAGHRHEMERFLDLCGYDTVQKAEIASWTVQPLPGTQVLFRGEVFGSRALLNPAMRGCPICLARRTASNPDLTSVAFRGEWQHRHVATCFDHGVPLALLWKETSIFKRMDFHTRLSEPILGNLDEKVDGQNFGLHSYDRWLKGRLLGENDPSDLGRYATDIADILIYHVGRDYLRIKGEHKTSRDRLEICRTGFAAICNQSEGVEGAFRYLSNRTARGSSYRSNFHFLHRALGLEFRDDDRLKVLRDRLRAHYIAHHPISLDEKIFGTRPEAKENSSMVDVQKYKNVDAVFVAAVLRNLGLDNRAMQRFRARNIFPSSYDERLREVILGLMFDQEMSTYMRVTKKELVRLRDDGLVQPTIGDPKIRLRWLKGDAGPLLRRLKVLSKGRVEDCVAEESIFETATRLKARPKEIIDMIENADLRLVHHSNGEFLPDYRISDLGS